VGGSAELWRTTGEAPFNEFFLKNYADFLPSLGTPPAVGWADVGPMGLWTYALSNRKEADSKAVAAVRERTVAAARALVERTNSNSYLDSMTTRDYVWGSNGEAASYGVYLLIASRFQPGPIFVDAARDNLHYLLGRNAFSLSWVTQVGENPYRYPHHRPSASGKYPGPWPGLLSGGPNKDRQDAVLAAFPKDLPRPRSMQIRWHLTRVIRFASIGRRRWSSCWPASCNEPPRQEPGSGRAIAVSTYRDERGKNALGH
jgi:endoglucanase